MNTFQLFCLFGFISLTSLGVCQSVKAESTPEQVERFLDENVINRTVTKAGEGKSTDGKREYTFQRDMTFCNLQRNGDVIQFDEVSVIRHQVWELDEKGQRQGDAVSKDRILVFRFELKHKRSTDAMVGFSRIMTSTIDDGAATASEVSLRLDHESLEMSEKTVGYDDDRKADGTPSPRKSATTKKFALVDGKLVISTTNSKTIRLDASTGKVAESNDDALPPDDVQSALLPR